MKIRWAQYGISHDHASGKARVMQENDEVDFCGIFEPTSDTRNTLRKQTALRGCALVFVERGDAGR